MILRYPNKLKILKLLEFFTSFRLKSRSKLEPLNKRGISPITPLKSVPFVPDHFSTSREKVAGSITLEALASPPATSLARKAQSQISNFFTHAGK